jgi:hypothetical protein
MVDCSIVKGANDKTAALPASSDSVCVVNLADPKTHEVLKTIAGTSASAADPISSGDGGSAGDGEKKTAVKKHELTVADRISITSGFESLHLGTRPGDPNYKWNDNNYGIGARYEFTDKLGASVGYYYSSTRTHNTYASVDYDYYKGNKFSFGVSGGLVTGYQELHGKPAPLLVPTATQNLGHGFFVRELIIPPLHNVTPAVLSIQFGFHPAALFGHKD